MKPIPLLTDGTIAQLEKSLARLAKIKYAETGLPFVTLKYAQTLDGKIATPSGDSQWISGPSSLRLAHAMRACHDAVLVGVGTITRDNPRLTVRLVKGKDPLKVIVDSRLRIPLDSKILNRRAAQSTLIAATSISSKEKIIRIESTGARVCLAKSDGHGRVDLKDLLQWLGQEKIRSVLVEGGSKVIASLLRRRLVDHLLVAIAPKILGEGLRSVESAGEIAATNSVLIPTVRYFLSGEDIILQAFVSK